MNRLYKNIREKELDQHLHMQQLPLEIISDQIREYDTDRPTTIRNTVDKIKGNNNFSEQSSMMEEVVN